MKPAYGDFSQKLGITMVYAHPYRCKNFWGGGGTGSTRGTMGAGTLGTLGALGAL